MTKDAPATEQEYLDCLDLAMKRFGAQIVADGSNELCIFPSMRSVLSKSPELLGTLRPCQSIPDYLNTMYELILQFLFLYSEQDRSGCPDKESVETYEVKSVLVCFYRVSVVIRDFFCVCSKFGNPPQTLKHNKLTRHAEECVVNISVLRLFLQSSLVPRIGTAKIYVYFSTLDVTVESEYVLLDLPAAVAAVGGLIGMLLGWSLRDVAQFAAKVVDKNV